MLYKVRYTQTDCLGGKKKDMERYAIANCCADAIKFVKERGATSTSWLKFSNFNAFILAGYDGEYKLYDATWTEPIGDGLRNRIVRRTVVGRCEEEAIHYAMAYSSLDASYFEVKLIERVDGFRYDLTLH